MNVIRLSTGVEANALTLTPGGAIAGFVNAIMVPAVGSGETVEQVIDLQMGSTAAAIKTGINNLGRFLETAQYEANRPGGQLVYLECQAAAGDEVYRSPVYSGWYSLGPTGVDQREQGSQGGKLHLVRANWWERATEVTVTNGVAITNHRDAGHSNVAYAAGYFTTDDELPAQARVVVALDTAVTAPAALLVGMRAGTAGGLDLFYEGQDGTARAGVTGSTVADAASSNGSYYDLAWNGAA